MSKYTKLTVVGAALAIVSIVAGCGTTSGATPSTPGSNEIRTTNNVTTQNQSHSISSTPATNSSAIPNTTASDTSAANVSAGNGTTGNSSANNSVGTALNTTTPSVTNAIAPASSKIATNKMKQVIESLHGQSDIVQFNIPIGWKSYGVRYGGQAGTEWVNPKNTKDQIVLVTTGDWSTIQDYGENGTFTDTTHKNMYNYKQGDPRNPNYKKLYVPYIGYEKYHTFKTPVTVMAIFEVWMKNKTEAQQILSTVRFESTSQSS